MEQNLGVCWVSGKHSETVEIDSSNSTVAIGSFFAQGSEADEIIEQISAIYNLGNYTPLEACEKWADSYLVEY